MDMEHEIKKDAPSAQQAAGSIADDPQYKRMLWNVAQDWTRTDRHIALACYIERWADSRAAATPAQPIVPQTELTADLINLLNAIRPNFGDVGTRDVDVAAQRRRIDSAIISLGLIMAHDGREHPTPRPIAQPIADMSAPTDDEIFAIFRANCRDYAGNYEVSPGDALRIAKLLAARAAAPVSGQGASIGDDKEFRRLLENWHSQNKFVVAHESYKSLVAYIDSRPRSEDSRAATAPPADWRDVIAQARDGICAGGLAEYAQHERSIVEPHLDGIYDELEALEKQALASTTPQKADNE